MELTIYQIDVNTLSIYLELSLVLISSVFVLLILNKYLQRRKPLKLKLFFIFLFIVIGLFLVWVSLVTYYPLNVEGMDPYSILGWILYRIGYYRFTFILITISCYITYTLKVAIFNEGKANAVVRGILIIFGGINIFVSLFVFDEAPDAVIDDLLAFGLMFIYVLMVYLEFTIKSFLLARRLNKSAYKTAIQSLVIMSVCFILTNCFFLLDRVWIMLMGTYYSVFYYLADVSLIVGIIGAYFGYIRPKS